MHRLTSRGLLWLNAGKIWPELAQGELPRLSRSTLWTVPRQSRLFSLKSGPLRQLSDKEWVQNFLTQAVNKPNSESDLSRNRSTSGRQHHQRGQRSFDGLQFESKDGWRNGGRVSDRPVYDNDYSAFSESMTEPDWRRMPRPPPNFDFYQPSESVMARNDEEIQSFWRENHIQVVKGQKHVPKPILNFEESNFSDGILRTLSRQDFNTPMPIQAQGWPIALAGKDLVAIGQTGSGKTLGYLLPALMHIQNQKPLEARDGPIVLVMAPTRELVNQIGQVASTYCKDLKLKTACLFGGASRNYQLRNLDRGCHLVVATPGRLLDFLSTQQTNLARTSYVVLDEADRMLDMGFEPQIRQILDQVPPERQMLMWSATWPQGVQELATDFFRSDDHIHLNIGSTELHANKNITQIVEVLTREDKIPSFMSFMSKARDHDPNARILVFADTKRAVDMLQRILHGEHIRSHAIHGDKSQTDRDRAIQDFRSGRISTLIATNVAARGLDVDDVKCVFNFDLPTSIEDYVHRIGRTGRRDKSGVSYTLVTSENINQVDELIQVLKEADQKVNPDLIELSRLKRQNRGSGKKPFRSSEGYSKPRGRKRF